MQKPICRNGNMLCMSLFDKHLFGLAENLYLRTLNRKTIQRSFNFLPVLGICQQARKKNYNTKQEMSPQSKLHT